MKRAAGSAPIIGIAGWKKSGKTTLAVRLIEEFTRRGLAVATIKHAHHNFQIDDAETDSARHRRAGAAQVAVVSAKRWALINELGGAPEPGLADMIARLGPCDLVIVEGYKSAAIPKIEVRRSAACEPGDACRPRCQRHRRRRRPRRGRQRPAALLPRRYRRHRRLHRQVDRPAAVHASAQP